MESEAQLRLSLARAVISFPGFAIANQVALEQTGGTNKAAWLGSYVDLTEWHCQF